MLGCSLKIKGGVNLISREEFAHLVDWATNNYIKIPATLVSNYDAWECRGTLGRYLYVAKQYKQAISVLETVVDVKAGEGNGDDHYNPTELEMKVWNLQWLSIAIQSDQNDTLLALKYMKKALRLADRSKVYFHFVVRGQLWLNCLLYKAMLGRRTQAKREARLRLGKLVLEVGRSNSYYFFGYAFLAKMAMDEGKPQVALDLFKNGFKAYNIETLEKEEIARADSCSNPAEAFEILWTLIDIPYRLWDEPEKWNRGDSDECCNEKV